MKLAIISHTKHYKTDQGEIVGWGPTVSEINHLAKGFEKIYHIGFLHKTDVPHSSLPYTVSNVEFIALKPIGGASVLDKLMILFSIPTVIKTVNSILQKVDVYQLRTPTGIALFLIPYLTLFTKKKGWYKYAGNWVQEKPPLGYDIQRWLLKKQSRKVTVNGQWPEDPKHIISFENPCLTNDDREFGKQIVEEKILPNKKSYCFVGGLYSYKGIDVFLEALKQIPPTDVEKVHIVGTGVLEEALKKVAKTITIPIIFHGALPRAAVFEVYKKSHFIMLPSKNEGFPKVISEAMNFGCIPIVSNVSCISQYIKDQKNGWLLHAVTVSEITACLEQSLSITNEKYRNIIQTNYEVAATFTYDYFVERMATEVLV